MLEDNNIYVYFNEKGEAVSKGLGLNTGPVRQGSDFTLNILFDKETSLIGEEGGVISVSFKCPGQTDYNLFPFVSYYDKYINEGSQSLSDNLTFTRIGNKTINGIEYQCWKFDSSKAYEGGEVLTERDGNLEVQVRITKNTTNVGSPSRTNSTITLGTFKIFVEKTLYHESPFDVSQMDLNRFLNDMEIATQTRGFGIHAFEIDFNTGDLKVYAERSDYLVGDNYEIDPATGELIIKI